MPKTNSRRGLAIAPGYRPGPPDYEPEPPEPLSERLPSAGLSDSEDDVMRLLAYGYTIGEIAAYRGRSHHTVKNQLETAYAKLGARNAANAAALWVSFTELPLISPLWEMAATA
jgi:DNA-binding CsgD family transcriptional regulator